MKFKYLTIAFSIIMVLILLMAVLLPLMLTNAPQSSAGLAPRSSPFSSAANFWYVILFLFLFIAIILVCFGVFFLLNYRLFSLLEREDWPALAYYLEQEIFVKGRCNARNVQLLASSYLVISDYSSVLNLESKAILVKPAVVQKNALIFGGARLLNGNYKEAVAFFRKYIDKDAWIHWYYGFTSLLSGANNQAESEFSALIASSHNLLITGLSAYFLTTNLVKYSKSPEDCRAVAENGRSQVIKKIKNAAGWKKEAAKMASEIHVAIIRKYVEETGIWLFNRGNL